MAARLTLVLGGIRSGKSALAEKLALPPVTYLATALAGDAEMTERIAAHKQRRPADWRTIEEPYQVAAVVAGQAEEGTLLVECLPLWLTNLLGRPEGSDEAIRAEVARLVEAIQRCRCKVIVVSGEVGSGIIPAEPLARRFGDLLGEANQLLAREASDVFWCVAGVPVRIKGGV